MSNLPLQMSLFFNVCSAIVVHMYSFSSQHQIKQSGTSNHLSRIVVWCVTCVFIVGGCETLFG